MQTPCRRQICHVRGLWTALVPVIKLIVQLLETVRPPGLELLAGHIHLLRHALLLPLLVGLGGAFLCLSLGPVRLVCDVLQAAGQANWYGVSLKSNAVGRVGCPYFFT